ncbi:MAG: hypothetical protein AB7I04_18475 [Pseudomonadales bacterium]
MTALTLAQYAQTEKQMLRKGIYLGLSREGIIADILKWRSLGGALSETGMRMDEVIQPDWVALGGAIASKTANLKPIEYGTYQMAVHLDIPEPLHTHNADKLQRDQMTQSKAALKGAAYELNDTFINGDQAADPNQFDGLNKIVTSLGSGQTVGTSDIDISDGGDQSERWAVIDRMLDAHRLVSGKKPDYAFCNDTFSSKFRGILMREGLLGDNHNWLTDTFNPGDPRKGAATPATRPEFVFDGVPYWDLGVKTDQSTRIIGNTYADAGGSATRIFLVKEGPDELEGIQADTLGIKEIGILEDTDVRRWRLTWMPGLACWGAQSIVKVAGIKVA